MASASRQASVRHDTDGDVVLRNFDVYSQIPSEDRSSQYSAEPGPSCGDLTDTASTPACGMAGESSRTERQAATHFDRTESRYRKLATTQLLRVTFRDAEDARQEEHAVLAKVLSTERSRNQVARLQVMDSIAKASLRLRVLEEQERRMSKLHESLESTARLPGGLAEHLDLVLQIVHDMNETRLYGGISAQQIAAAIMQRIRDFHFQASWEEGVCHCRLSFQQILQTFAKGDSHSAALQSSLDSCPFVLPLHQVGHLSLQEYLHLHSTYLQEMSHQISQRPGGEWQSVGRLAHELVSLRLAFVLTRWSTFLSFRTANAVSIPLSVMENATEKAQVTPQQARALQGLWTEHTAALAALQREEEQLKGQVQGRLRELSAAGIPGMSPAPYTQLLDTVEQMSANRYTRTMLDIDFNIRATFEVLHPSQMATLLALSAPHHLRLDLLLSNRLISADA